MRFPTILVDTREQKPFKFAGYKKLVRKLNYGDYSMIGYKKIVAVERKSPADLFGTMATMKSRTRFLAELERAEKAGADLYIVIEASPISLMRGIKYSGQSGHAVLRRLLKICREGKAIPIFGGNVAGAEEMTRLILESYLPNKT